MAMNETVLSAIISVVGSVVSSYTLVNWRLKQLEDKVDRHNAWGDKFQGQTTDIALIKQDVSYIKDAIKRLEK